MALVFETQYTLNFDSKQGEDITWELDILESYDDSGSRPAHFVDTPIPLVGTSEPIIIDYERDYDVYKPIQGSTASVNLVVNEAGQYADFSNGSPYQYQVRLRNKSGGDAAKGVRVVSDGGAQLTFAAETGTRIADRFSSGQISVRISSGDKTTSSPLLDSTNAGRWVYVSNDGGLTVVPIGTLRETDYSSPTRIQLFDTKGYGSDAALDLALAGYEIGDEVWLANEGDTGNSTTLAAIPETLNPFWCGFFSPVDASESVSYFPYEISFTAVDGLGLLEDSTPEESSSTGQVNAFQAFVIPALQQTGLGLNVYVDSGILDPDGNDGLLSATTDDQARYKDLEGSGELFTHKELLEGYLSAWNCKITQANGRWYIYNASSLSDTPTWKVFNIQGIAQADVTESLVKSIDGTTAQDLVPAFNDFQLNLRRPAGSIECNPKDLVERQFSLNGNFGSGDSTGWTIVNPSYASVDSFSPSDNGFALKINRSVGTLGNIFKPNVPLIANRVAINTNGYTVDPSHEVEFKFDHRWTKIRRSGKSFYRVYATFTTQQYVQVEVQEGYNYGQYYDRYTQDWATHTYVNSTSVVRLDWNSEAGEWDMNPDNGFTEFNQEDEDTWANESQTLASISGFFGEKRDITNLQLFVEFYASDDTTLLAQPSTTMQEYWIDNVSIQNVFSNNADSPTFERVQPNFVHTIEYEPLFSSSTSSAIYQTLFPQLYGRVGQPGESTSLEQIGTQQKLNDFREQFKYYEGSLINLDSTPLSNINKINLNWVDDNYVETAPGIMNGGSFRVKSNVFDTSFYIPNQASDQSSDYYTQNVNLVRSKFPGRSELVTYTLAFKVTATDNTVVPALEVDNGLVPSEPFIQVIGRPGEVRHYKLNLVPGSGYVGDIPNTSIAAATDSTPLPLFATTGSFGYNQGNIEVPLTITIPTASEFEELYLNGGIDAFDIEQTPDAVPVTIQVANNIGSSTSVSSIPVTGIPGDIKSFSVIVNSVVDGSNNPTHTFRNLDASDNSDDITFIGAAGNNTASGTFIFEYEVPSTPPTSTLTVTLTGTAIANTVDPSQIRNRNLVITNNSSSTVSITDGTTVGNVTTIPFVGVVGTTSTRSITFKPVAGREVENITPSGFNSSLLSFDTAAGTGDEFELPVTLSYVGGAVNEDIPVTVSANTSVEPYSVEFHVRNQSVSGATPSIENNSGNNTIRFSYSQADLDSSDSIDSFVVALTPDANMIFPSNASADINIDEGAVTTASGDTISFDESAFTAAKQSTLGPNGEIRWVIEGDYPSPGGNYSVDINLVGASQQAPATAATVTALTTGISASGGNAIFEVDTNGATEYSIEVTANTTGGVDLNATDNFNGSFSESISASAPAGLLEIIFSGSYGPTESEAGVITISLDADAIPIDSKVSSTGDPNVLYATEVTYTLRAHPAGNTGVILNSGALPAATIQQLASNGGRTVTIATNSTTSDNSIVQAGLALSTALPTWTLNF